MKFEYDTTNTEPSPVAYIDYNGNLMLMDGDDHRQGVCVYALGGDAQCGFDFEPLVAGVQRVFYPGDKLTITF